jgi:RNA polymerase sigma-70 factor (ECF subfamily)
MTRLAALAANAADGEDGGYEALVRALWPSAYRIAWSILGSREAAEDVAQTACAAICEKLPSLAKKDAFAAWAYRIIISRARDHARAMGRLRARETVGYDEAIRTTTDVDLTVNVDLEAAIRRLAEPLRLAIELHYFFGLSSREAGIALGVPAETVRFRLMLARRRLRPLLCDSAAPSTSELVS